MRDPERIQRIIDKLITVWSMDKDCRFGQLVYAIFWQMPQTKIIDEHVPKGNICHRCGIDPVQYRGWCVRGIPRSNNRGGKTCYIATRFVKRIITKPRRIKRCTQSDTTNDGAKNTSFALRFKMKLNTKYAENVTSLVVIAKNTVTVSNATSTNHWLLNQHYEFK